jgi:hypothetical protein
MIQYVQHRASLGSPDGLKKNDDGTIDLPTPRWSAFDAVRYKTEMSDDVLMTTQERAYTSPIWYTP